MLIVKNLIFSNDVTALFEAIAAISFLFVIAASVDATIALFF